MPIVKMIGWPHFAKSGIRIRHASRFLGDPPERSQRNRMKYYIALLFAAAFCFGGMTNANAADRRMDLSYHHHHWHHWHHWHHHHR
jgi:hypothetical protein